MNQVKKYFHKTVAWMEKERQFRNVDAVVIWALILCQVLR